MKVTRDMVSKDLVGRYAVGRLMASDREALDLDPPRHAASPATVRKRRQRALSRLRVVWRKLHGAF